MKFPVTVIALAGLTLTLAAQAPTSASEKPQRPAAKYTSVKSSRVTPTVPVQAASTRQDTGGDNTDIAIRIQDAHHGDGAL